jgi:hypothetical protein
MDKSKVATATFLKCTCHICYNEYVIRKDVELKKLVKNLKFILNLNVDLFENNNFKRNLTINEICQNCMTALIAKNY